MLADDFHKNKYAKLSNSYFCMCWQIGHVMCESESTDRRRGQKKTSQHIRALSDPYSHARTYWTSDTRNQMKRNVNLERTNEWRWGISRAHFSFMSLSLNVFLSHFSAAILLHFSIFIRHHRRPTRYTYSYDSRSFFVIILPRSCKSSTIKSAKVPL